MTPIEMAEAMEGRARVRRKITNREDTGDRLSDQLEQAATMLRKLDGQLAFRIDAVKSYQKSIEEKDVEIEALKKQLDKAIDTEKDRRFE